MVLRKNLITSALIKDLLCYGVQSSPHEVASVQQESMAQQAHCYFAQLLVCCMTSAGLLQVHSHLRMLCHGDDQLVTVATFHSSNSQDSPFMTSGVLHAGTLQGYRAVVRELQAF